MASHHTTHYGLSQWAGSDPFKRMDFNDDNAKIDAALQTLNQSKVDQDTGAALLQQITDGDAALQQQITAGDAALQQQITAGDATLQQKITDGDAALQQQITAAVTDVTLRCRMKTGVYYGDGASIRFIDMGFPVLAVHLENEIGSRNLNGNSATKGGLAVKGGSIYNGTMLANVKGNGFSVYNGSEYQGGFNQDGVAYHYAAWG